MCKIQRRQPIRTYGICCACAHDVQLQNKWRVHKAWLQPLHEQGRELASWFFQVGGSFDVEHVLRDQNKVADALSNIACDRAALL